MLLASSHDSKATAFSLSFTSQPFICTSKISRDGQVKMKELASLNHIPIITIIHLTDMNEKMD